MNRRRTVITYTLIATIIVALLEVLLRLNTSAYALENQPPTPPMPISPASNVYTNRRQIVFETHPSRDRDGDEIEYNFVLAHDADFSEIAEESGWSRSTRWGYVLSRDGRYYWRVTARAGQHSVDSSPLNFLFDATPPGTPVISPAPPLTIGTSKTIEWTVAQDNLDPTPVYEVEISTDRSFTDSRPVSIDTTEYTVDGLALGTTYHYRLRAKDWAGNYSDYSNVISSTQIDSTVEIPGFTLDPSFISPNGSTSIGISDVTQISGDISEFQVTEAKLMVTNGAGEVIMEISVTSSFSISWPTLPQYIPPEGNYYCFVSMNVSGGQILRSTPLDIVVDNTPPNLPDFHNPVPQSYINTKHVVVDVHGEPESNLRLFLNNIRSRESSTGSINTRLAPLPEGPNIIRASLFDKALNEASTEIKFHVDTIAPEKPTLSATVDDINQKIDLDISGEIGTSYIIFVNGKETQKSELSKSPLKTTANITWQWNTTYTTEVRLEDLAGNLSNSAVSVVTTPPEPGIGGGVPDIGGFPTPPPSGYCIISVNEEIGEYTIDNCQHSIPRVSTAHQSDQTPDGLYWISVYGTIQSKLKLLIYHNVCKPATFWDPRTWVTCVDQTVSTSTEEIVLLHDLSLRISNNFGVVSAYRQKIQDDGRFSFDGYSYTDLTGQNATLFDSVHKSVTIAGVNIQISGISLSNVFTIDSNGNAPSTMMSFVFGEPVGVTQWHGYTAFQSPHTGIDFGVALRSVISPYDGTISETGWDGYGGPCLSGGNFVRIDHDNGMSTMYLHMDSVSADDGAPWIAGARISRGQQIGISGNTGSWNCQQLGYHLHFETRTEQSQISHTDPVPHIDADWSQIPTLGWETYPERLTGDNPHPGY